MCPKLVQKAARYTIGHYCYKQSISSMMKSIEWKMPSEMIHQLSARFIHKIIVTKSPSTIHTLIRFPRLRESANIHSNTRPKTQRMTRTAILASIDNYNRIPNDMRHLPPCKLKLKLNKTSLKPRLEPP